MKKLFLIKNPDVFQGESKLNTDKMYFEGWYYKNTNSNEGIAFIPGINIDKKDRNAFIQVITRNSSYFINYNINDFEFNLSPFYIKIGNSTFSKDGINIDIKDNTQNIRINGEIKYKNSININTNFLSPNVMGPFSYIPFMECNHAILSMKSNINGEVIINDKKISFYNNVGYIEKDWGYSFPKSYIWCQANDFKNPDVSFMISIADIPFKMFSFRGIICVLIINGKEYKFTTYNNVKLLEYELNKNYINITLKKGKYNLNIKSNYDKGLKLSAPIKGEMKRDIYESISSLITITLKENNNVIFSDTSKNCGLELVD